MTANVEIKARLGDPAAMRRRVEALAGPVAESLEQEDTFFAVASGRLKLRKLRPDRGELIFYRREDIEGPKRSEYRLSVTADPDGLRELLAEALGVLGVVRKRRTLFLLGRTRIHLDEVEGLGSFLELEVMLRTDEPVSSGAADAEGLRRRLGVADADLVRGAYLDLLRSQRG